MDAAEARLSSTDPRDTASACRPVYTARCPCSATHWIRRSRQNSSALTTVRELCLSSVRPCFRRHNSGPTRCETNSQFTWKWHGRTKRTSEFGHATHQMEARPQKFTSSASLRPRQAGRSGQWPSRPLPTLNVASGHAGAKLASPPTFPTHAARIRICALSFLRRSGVLTTSYYYNDLLRPRKTGWLVATCYIAWQLRARAAST